MHILLGQQMEPQFADLRAEVAGVGLAEGIGPFGEQAGEKSARRSPGR